MTSLNGCNNKLTDMNIEPTAEELAEYALELAEQAAQPGHGRMLVQASKMNAGETLRLEMILSPCQKKL